jgi:hypothetical protein
MKIIRNCGARAAGDSYYESYRKTLMENIEI